jgi:hypothetical protein
MCAPPAPFMPPDLVGTPIVALIVLWAGATDDARDGIAALDALGEPAVDLVGPTTYAAVQQIMDQGAPAVAGTAHGRRVVAYDDPYTYGSAVREARW